MRIIHCLLLLMTLLLSACFAPDVIRQERVFFQDYIADNPDLQRHTLHVGDDQLFYAAAGDPRKPALVIIHGTPGNWHQYARYMLSEPLLNDFYVIVIDRPGWGQSALGGRQKLASFEEQSVIVAALAERLKADSNDQPVILMGHSLGASVSPRVAMDHPQAIDGLILFAGTIDPDLANPRWFNRAGAIPVIDWMIGIQMQKANKEVFALKEELKAMEPRWGALDIPVLVVQGMKDTLVYPANSEFARNHLDSQWTQVIELPEDGHLFPMTRRDDVVDWSRCMLQKIQTQGYRCQVN